MKNKFKIIMFLVLSAAVLGGISGFFYLRKNGYETVVVRKGEIVEAVYGLGTVKTDAQYEVKIGVASTLDRIYVKEGDVVRVGTALVKFEPSLTFKSPISGTVTLVDAHEAELVQPQTTVVRVENLEDRYIEVAMEQEGALRVEVAQKAAVLFESLRGERFEGKVTAVFSRNQEFLAHIEISGLQKSILPGMTADVAIQVSRHENALLVPLSSLQGGRVIVVDGKGKRKINVKIGAIDGAWGEVLDGDLHAGDRVIVRKQEKKE